jgi:signal transduction histidine kinase
MRSRRAIPGLSLRLRVFLLMAAVLAPAMLLLSSINYRQMRQFVEWAAQSRGQLAARDLAAWAGERTFQVVNEEAVRELDRRLASWSDALELALFELEEGELRPIAARGRGPGAVATTTDNVAGARDEPYQEVRIDGDERVLETSSPVHRGGRITGVARTRLSLSAADALLARTAREVFLLTALALVVLGALLHFYMGQAVSGPVQSLVTTMRRVTEGERSALAEVRGGGEIGWLALSLNHMLQNLRRSEEQNTRLLAQISGMNEELQKRIEEATEELARKNEELKGAHERLFSVQRDLSRLERMASLGQLAGEIAHEVGTPLNAISGHIQLLRRDAASLSGGARERLEIVEAQVDRLATIIRSFLTTLRPRGPSTARIELPRLLAEVVRFTAPLLEGKGITVRVEGEAGLRDVAADASQIEQVFLNLLTNSMDAMPGGGEIVVRTRNVGGGDGAAQVEVRWSDSGQGIAPEDVRRVFQPLYTSKAPGSGSGLGLSICREIVRQHGGEIRAESAPGQGTTFVLTLPAVG